MKLPVKARRAIGGSSTFDCLIWAAQWQRVGVSIVIYLSFPSELSRCSLGWEIPVNVFWLGRLLSQYSNLTAKDSVHEHPLYQVVGAALVIVLTNLGVFG
jgi:hypothetical protein